MLDLTQNREGFRRVLGNDDAVDSLLANLQCKMWCQNSGETNEWAARLLGERWTKTISTNIGHSAPASEEARASVTRSDQRRYYVDPAEFTVLRRGGTANHLKVDAIVYNGGHIFAGGLPYTRLTFDQA